MARTRASKGNNTAANADKSSTTLSTSKSKYALSQPSENPPRIFILPTKATGEARIVSLLHPRYAKPTRYLVCPETGFYEFTSIAAPKSTPHSWLIQTDDHNHEQLGTETEPESSKKDATFNTYVTSGAELFVATPIDPLFLVLPTLVDSSTKSEKRRYISSDDHFDRIQETSPHLWEIMRWGGGRVRRLLEERLGAVCDTVEIGDERVFRFSEDKLMTAILDKARRMSARSLPQSMEEKFVVKPLEAPVLGIKREATITTTTVVTATQTSAEPVNDGSSTPEPASDAPKPKIEAQESQSFVSSTGSSASGTSEVTTAATSIITSEEQNQDIAGLLRPAMVASPEIISLQRMRTAFNFLCSSYIPPSLVTVLRAKSSAQSDTDFGPLDAYLPEVNRLKQEAAAAWSAGDYGRKRFLDEEEAADRAEKKRKKEEEEKRKKAGESRGVRELKKVNTTGMKKMSDFFKKKT